MFNLKRHAAETQLFDQGISISNQGDLKGLDGQLSKAVDTIKQQNGRNINTPEEGRDLIEDKQTQDMLPALQGVELLILFRDDRTFTPQEKQMLQGMLNRAGRIGDSSINLFKSLQSGEITPQEAAADNMAKTVARTTYEKLKPQLFNEILKWRKNQPPRPNQRKAFNLQKFKSAQLEMPPAPVAPPPADPMQSPPAGAQPQSQNVLPVNDVGEFISKIINILSTGNEQAFNAAQSEVVGQVSQDIEQEAQSAFDSLREYLGFVEDEEQIASILTSIYGLLPTIQNDTTSEVPSEPLKEPIAMAKSFNLSKYVLNNQPGFQKEAYTNLGDAYLLYGPTEKRICPKLRGKGGGKVGAADVVSEEICRFHCLDGIIIDDNKTVCGEAVWRAHVMDKFSREYVDKDGNIVGGYLNKRFEINRNVPEENKMRLKPGETRKPRPPAWGNTESRLQDMRNKEGQTRGYTPTNEGQPFDWTTDVDQNNVNVDQAERDRREEAMGHQLVQYSKKDQQENDPKVIKKAQYDGLQDYYENAAMENRATEGEARAKKIIDKARVLLEQNNDAASVKRILQNEFPNLDDRELDYYISKGQQKSLDVVANKKSFNLKKFKTAQVATMESPTAVICKHCGAKVMMTQHQDGTERCPNCGQPQKPDFSYPRFVTGPGAQEDQAYAENKQNIKEAKKKDKKKKDKKGDFEFRGEKFDVNPFAVCHSQGLSKKKDPNKYESCITQVKEKSKKAFNLKEFKIAQMAPPVGPDNPRSDNLGLSPEFADPANLDNHEAYDLEGNSVSIPLQPGEYDAIFGENANPATMGKLNEALTKLGQDYSTEISAPNADQNKIDFQVDTSKMPTYMREGLEEDLRSTLDRVMTSTRGITTALASKKKT